MSDTLSYGYQSGYRTVATVLLDSTTTAIVVGDGLVLATAGYYKKAGAGEEVQCIACAASAVPDADGGLAIVADFSTETIYKYPPDTGSFVVGDVGKLCDWGGSRTLNRDASATGAGGDGIFQILAVDTTANTALVKMAKPLVSGA
jgi:hypothetical protein